MQTNSLARFSAIYCSGAYIPNGEAVTAMALLFDQVYLPNNVTLIREFVRKYNVAPILSDSNYTTSINIVSDEGESSYDSLFSGLTPAQGSSAKNYLARALTFANHYADLYGPIFQSEMFPGEKKFQIKTERSDESNSGNKFKVSFSNTISFETDDETYFPKLLDQGLVPVVGRFHAASPLSSHDVASTRQLASLLAMKAVEMVLPKTAATHPEIILEARYKLRHQLPAFWSAMLKASVELRKFAADGKSQVEVSREATDLVDRTIRPALIDLATKLEKERKDWFYRILSPVRSGLRLLVGNPPLTQQQLITNAMILASDTCLSIADNMRSIDSLKRESGLAYLLDLSTVVNDQLP
jgi:hypothetical protein